MKNWFAVVVVSSLGLAGAGCNKKPAAPAPAAVKPSEPAAKPAEAKPAEGEAKPAEGEAKPAEGEAKPAEAKPAEAEAKPAEGEAKPAEAEAKPAEGEAKPEEAEAKPAEGEAKPAEAGDRAAGIIRGMQLASEGKWEESFAGYTEGAVWDAVGRTQLNGRAAIIEEMKQGRATFPDMQIKPSMIFDLGDKAVVIAVVHATNSGPLGDMPATNKTVGVESAMVFEYDAEGKINRVTEYFDDQKMMAQLGVIPASEGMPVPPVRELPAETQVIKGEAPEGNLATAKAIMEAFKKDTFAAKLRETLAADFSMEDPMTGAVLAGADTCIASLEKGLFAMWPDYTGTATWASAAGDWVILGLDNQGTYKGGIPGIEAKDQATKFRSLDFMHYEGGKVKSYKSFANGIEIMRALGMGGPAEGHAEPGEKPAGEEAKPEGAAEEKPAEEAKPEPAGEDKGAEGGEN